jgi:hypothetical protein
MIPVAVPQVGTGKCPDMRRRVALIMGCEALKNQDNRGSDAPSHWVGQHFDTSNITMQTVYTV